MDYLKSDQYYADLYDLLTIKECLRIIEFWQKVTKENFNDEKIKHLSEEKRTRGFQQFLNMKLLVVKTSEYQRKKETIQKWIKQDKIKQEKYDNTLTPIGIHCPGCSRLLDSTFKHLQDYTNEPLRVLFFFECHSCKIGRGIYENGEERLPKPDLCNKCGKEVKPHVVRKGNIITRTSRCLSCGFIETEVDDLDKQDIEWEQKKQKDKELLEKYRGEFCLSDEKGQENIELFEKMEVAHEVFEEEKQKFDNSIYQKSLQLKKLSIIELEKLLTELLEKEKYVKLTLDKPQIGQYVIVPFTAQDADSSRKGFDGIINLEKLIKMSLEDTNWRLVNGLDYRLGYVSGQLKGYERDEDMLELAGRKKSQQLPREKSANRIKYEYDNLVQLAKMQGEFEGIQNMRKRRLEKEPEGFHLEGDGVYTCFICGNSMSGITTWYDKWGQKCIRCKRNIDAGVIPPEINDYDTRGETWHSFYQIQDFTKLHPATIRKLVRTGELKARQLIDERGLIYCQIFMVEENKEFIERFKQKNTSQTTP